MPKKQRYVLEYAYATPKWPNIPSRTNIASNTRIFSTYRKAHTSSDPNYPHLAGKGWLKSRRSGFQPWYGYGPSDFNLFADAIDVTTLPILDFRVYTTKAKIGFNSANAAARLRVGIERTICICRFNVKQQRIITTGSRILILSAFGFHAANLLLLDSKFRRASLFTRSCKVYRIGSTLRLHSYTERNIVAMRNKRCSRIKKYTHTRV